MLKLDPWMLKKTKISHIVNSIDLMVKRIVMVSNPSLNFIFIDMLTSNLFFSELSDMLSTIN